jgi:hypothetical protein
MRNRCMSHEEYSPEGSPPPGFPVSSFEDVARAMNKAMRASVLSDFTAIGPTAPLSGYISGMRWQPDYQPFIISPPGSAAPAVPRLSDDRPPADLAAEREQELIRQERAIMGKVPDVGSQWAVVAGPASPQHHREWIDYRAAYVISGSPEDKLAMEGHVTHASPPRAPEMAAPRAVSAPKERGGVLSFRTFATVCLASASVFAAGAFVHRSLDDLAAFVALLVVVVIGTLARGW